ncbi:Sec-independent protein translocase subunit TatA/TatB [Campylobacter mucosalis]|uniref:Sec-independent protein translocase protein TatA n=1 Tax=Campylobacter mucosalis CCUG 21559 TaxID=1032067 RepID=A0A6G5QFJ4_9BACT|nr:twin-arginine translocase TatA/TatE family subunit [Campylobacter mucosalis]KEA45276.1 preprotein translocase subunit TatA [Campylobacter mucosalis]QCD44369.1 twin arginine translocation system, TatA/E family protein [Campylobacter mucosalis CCUG 21559]QKF63710.1 twin arginine translocation system, TatA/E family protein [Campylobacter mucosalis]
MGISVQQLLIILVIIVLLFGAKKIPELAKGVGKGIKSFKAEMEDDKPVEKVEKKDEEVVSEVKKTESKEA